MSSGVPTRQVRTSPGERTCWPRSDQLTGGSLYRMPRACMASAIARTTSSTRSGVAE